MPKSADVRHFYTNVAGVSHKNPDGSSRQRIIAACDIMERLDLIHDPDNPHDSNATEVRRLNGAQIGFLSADVAGRMIPHVEAGYQYAAFISSLTGGTSGKRTRGVNLLIIVAGPSVSAQQAQTYVNSISGEIKTSDSSGSTGCLTAVLIAAAMLLIIVAAIKSVS